MNLEKIIRYAADYKGRELRIMEVCGTHTASIFKNGIKSIISPRIKLISGPGCPVCVTPASYIDKAIKWAEEPSCTLLTFGDMMKVPGTQESLSEAKANGAKVEMMYSPQEALPKAAANPDNTYILACVGFETTIPAYCLLLEEAEKNNIRNIKFLTALRRVIPALKVICTADNEIDAFLAPGHVSTILGSLAYSGLALQYCKPFAVAGFEAEHILIAVYDLLKQTENGLNEVHNLYPSAVRPEGNPAAMNYITRYFQEGPAYWRGIEMIEDSGYYLREKYLGYDAGSFELTDESNDHSSKCRCGEVITGKINPDQCPMFRKSCTPAKPKGPCMVSSEGTCGIWYKYSDS